MEKTGCSGTLKAYQVGLGPDPDIEVDDVSTVEPHWARAQVQAELREHQELSLCKAASGQTEGRGKLLLEHSQPEEIQGMLGQADAECLIISLIYDLALALVKQSVNKMTIVLK